MKVVRLISVAQYKPAFRSNKQMGVSGGGGIGGSEGVTSLHSYFGNFMMDRNCLEGLAGGISDVQASFHES